MFSRSLRLLNSLMPVLFFSLLLATPLTNSGSNTSSISLNSEVGMFTVSFDSTEYTAGQEGVSTIQSSSLFVYNVTLVFDWGSFKASRVNESSQTWYATFQVPIFTASKQHSVFVSAKYYKSVFNTWIILSCNSAVGYVNIMDNGLYIAAESVFSIFLVLFSFFIYRGLRRGREYVADSIRMTCAMFGWCLVYLILGLLLVGHTNSRGAFIGEGVALTIIIFISSLIAPILSLAIRPWYLDVNIRSYTGYFNWRFRNLLYSDYAPEVFWKIYMPGAFVWSTLFLWAALLVEVFSIVILLLIVLFPSLMYLNTRILDKLLWNEVDKYQEKRKIPAPQNETSVNICPIHGVPLTPLGKCPICEPESRPIQEPFRPIR